MGALVKKDPGQKEREREREKASKRTETEGLKKRARRTRGGDGWREKKGGYAAFRGN